MVTWCPLGNHFALSDLLSNDFKNNSFYLKVENARWHSLVQCIRYSAAGNVVCLQEEVRGQNWLPRFLPLEEIEGFKAEI